MTVLDERPSPPAPTPEHRPTGILAWLTTTDHKRIGVSYMVTAYLFFLLAGLLALVLRAELYEPGLQVVSEGRYNELFTMHGLIMLILFLGPFGFGLANYFVPLHVGAGDMAFPRLNALSYWLYLGGGLTMVAGFLTEGGAAATGWTLYPSLSREVWSPSIGVDLALIGIALTGFSGVLTAVNVVTTVFALRAPGMTMFRMPIFTWNLLVVSILVLMVFPVLTAAGAMLLTDRLFGGHVFDPTMGGSTILWQHLFWFFGHPEVYIIVLPFFGVVTEVLPVFSQRPVFGYKGLVFATLAIAAYSVGVWAHHMFTTGAVLLPFFSFLSFLIAVPTGVKFVNWIGTMWGGRLRFTTAMWFAFAFLFTFLLGGITGVIVASPPLDFHLHDSYFVVAHMHYVLFGGSVFALYAGVYYWFPKITGRHLHEGLGTLHAALTFVGFHLTFAVQHLLGMDGMPRRIADYLPEDGFTGMNQLSTVGSAVLGLGTLVFVANVWRSWRHGAVADADAWGAGQTLEWWTASPPPPGNFDRPLPPIRSNRPVWDARHPPEQSGGSHEGEGTGTTGGPG